MWRGPSSPCRTRARSGLRGTSSTLMAGRRAWCDRVCGAPPDGGTVVNATLTYPLPTIIQGGMGIGVSDWRLARAVSLRGQLGVVSGTCIDSLFVRRLQDGDVGGHIRRAMERFPMPRVSAEVL